MFIESRFIILGNGKLSRKKLFLAWNLLINLPGIKKEQISIFTLDSFRNIFSFSSMLLKLESFLLSDSLPFKFSFMIKRCHLIREDEMQTLIKSSKDLVIVKLGRDNHIDYVFENCFTISLENFNFNFFPGFSETISKRDNIQTSFQFNNRHWYTKLFTRNYISSNYAIFIYTLINEINYSFEKGKSSLPDNIEIEILYNSTVFNFVKNAFLFFKYLIERTLYFCIFRISKYRYNWESFVHDSNNNLTYHLVVPNMKKGDFVADPFIFKKNSQLYCFAEFFEIARGKGKIVLFEYRNGSFEYVCECLSEDFHLSYPFIFEFEDQFFMCPETSEIAEIRLYVANEFPYSWKYYCTLISNYHAVDTNIFYYENRWHLLTNNVYPNTKDYSVYLSHFKGKTLNDLVQNPSSSNIIYKDCGKARSGGFWIENSSIYRVNQIQGFNTYGKSIELSKIEFDKEANFREIPSALPVFLNTVEFKQMHHLTKSDNFYAFDIIKSKRDKLT